MNTMNRAYLVLLAVALAACQQADDGADVTNDRPDEGAALSAPSADEVAAGEIAADEPASEGKAGRDAVGEAQSSGGKPTAPISIDYSVVGTPLVGQPVNINLEVSSTLPNQPVTLNYRINDARNLSFPPAQAQRVALAPLGDVGSLAQQVTVVPQQEGRLYLNVTAEVETAEGMLLKSIAIPIQVGRSPRQPEANGEVREDADGEAVNSMPAQETTR